MAIDLRKELETILSRKWDHVVLRHLTQDKCQVCFSDDCSNPRATSRTADPECPNCEGLGYIFEEYLLKCKQFNASSMGIAHNQQFYYGGSLSNLLVLYFAASEVSDKLFLNDLIYQLKTNLDGTLVDPLVRIRKWDVIDSYELNLDNGKREFIKVYCKPKPV